MSQEAAERAALKTDQELYWCGATNERLHQYLSTFLAGDDPRFWNVVGINNVCLTLPEDRKEHTRIRLTAALLEYRARIDAHKS